MLIEALLQVLAERPLLTSKGVIWKDVSVLQSEEARATA
jgi:hypothetical protein